MADEAIAVLAAKLAEMPMSPEAMLELVIYCQREQRKVEALNQIADEMRKRIAKVFQDLPEGKRESRKSGVGSVSFTEPGEKIELLDRDNTVAMLTDEQLRITYKPDLKAMETILKKDEFERHIKRSSTNPKITIREDKKSDDWDELDF